MAKGGAVTIENGNEVLFDYTLTVEGEVVDSSEKRGPLQYTHGQGQIIPGLERQLEGLKVGDERVIEVSPEDAYGVENPKAYQEIARSSLAGEREPEVGMFIELRTPDGRAFPGKITEVRKDVVVIDLNHPLAGKTLNFQVKIVSVQ